MPTNCLLESLSPDWLTKLCPQYAVVWESPVGRQSSVRMLGPNGMGRQINTTDQTSTDCQGKERKAQQCLGLVFIVEGGYGDQSRQ